jgi:serine/threonine-protein kinase
MAHDNILGIDEIVTNPRGGFAFTHPYMPRNLDNILSAARHPEFETLMTFAQQIVSALAYAHHFKGLDGKIRRIYHLHLQATQIIVDEDTGSCKIAGLGYTQVYRNLTQARQPRWQDPGMNPAYMPPEFFRSARGSTFERAADLYSLGTLLYYIVAGEFPFEGPGFDDFKFQHAKVFPPPPRLANPEVPDWIEPLILACMEKNHDQRPKSVAEIEEAFRKEWR